MVAVNGCRSVLAPDGVFQRISNWENPQLMFAWSTAPVSGCVVMAGVNLEGAGAGAAPALLLLPRLWSVRSWGHGSRSKLGCAVGGCEWMTPSSSQGSRGAGSCLLGCVFLHHTLEHHRALNHPYKTISSAKHSMYLVKCLTKGNNWFFDELSYISSS